MKCPVCNSSVSSNPYREWRFNIYNVKRYKCENCGANFNVYEYNGTEKYTIPKRF